MTMLWQANAENLLRKMQGMQPRIESALRLLDQAVWKYRPSQLYAMFSGGYDSLCAAHVAAQHPLFSGVLHINTGIGVEQTRQYVRMICRQYGWPLVEYSSPITYEDIIYSGGFPGPPLHPIVYSKLKERAIRRFMNDHKRHFHDRILLAAGARSQESRRRMSTTQAMRQEDVRIWVNPLIDWSKADILDYMEIHTLPHNQVVDVLHMSGECLCGCFAQADELPTLEIWYPETAAYIHWLEARVFERGFPWGWGQSPPKGWRAIQQGQLLLPEVEMEFLPLCTSCDARFARRVQIQEIGNVSLPPASRVWSVPALPPPVQGPLLVPAQPEIHVPTPSLLRIDDWPAAWREDERNLLQHICQEENIPFTLVTELLQLELREGRKSNRAGVQPGIQELLSRDWLPVAAPGELETPIAAQVANPPLVPDNLQQLSLW